MTPNTEAIKALKDAVEGECDGLAITDTQAQNILYYLRSEGAALSAQAAPKVPCSTCNDNGAVGNPPDNYFPCPACAPLPEAKAQAVPDGWKLVPIEPTEKMMDAAWDHTPLDMDDMTDGDFGQAYKDMLDAAPHPPSEVHAAPVAWRWVWKSKPHDIEGWCYTNQPPTLPDLQLIEPLYAAPQPPAPSEPELVYCKYCQGSGESTHVVGRGPDAHDEPCNCDKCGGTGVFQAGRTVDVGQLEYEGYSVSFIHSKMKACQYVLDTAWEALKKAGIRPDGNTSIAMGIERLATPQPQAAQPVGKMEESSLIPGLIVPVVPAELPVGTKLYTAAPALTEEQEREAFEREARAGDFILRRVGTAYANRYTQTAWGAWKARAALRSTQGGE